jgi:hypothetical protein
MPFKIAGEDYADSSLERLIETFRKLTDNESLVADLRQFRNERNFLSHKGITHCLDYEGELFDPTALEFKNRLTAIQDEAQRLYIAIHEEAKNSEAICGSMTLQKQTAKLNARSRYDTFQENTVDCSGCFFPCLAGGYFRCRNRYRTLVHGIRDGKYAGPYGY